MALPSTFADNLSQPAPATTVGFKISKPGYDALRTSGSNYVFDSSWPSLPIAYELVIDNPITSSANGTLYSYPHKLNFVPFAVCWAYFPDPSGIGMVGGRFIPTVDATNVYLSREVYNYHFNATKIIIRCFQLDITKDIEYSLAPGDSFNMPYDPNFGIKIVKPNKSINSTDMRDFALHSRCQSPLILAVKTEQTTNPSNPAGVVQYTAKTNHPVWSYGFGYVDDLNSSPGTPAGSYVVAPLYAQATPATFTDGYTTYIEANSSNKASLVVLRDPMFAPNAVTVQY